MPTNQQIVYWSLPIKGFCWNSQGKRNQWVTKITIHWCWRLKRGLKSGGWLLSQSTKQQRQQQQRQQSLLPSPDYLWSSEICFYHHLVWQEGWTPEVATIEQFKCLSIRCFILLDGKRKLEFLFFFNFFPSLINGKITPAVQTIVLVQGFISFFKF